MPFINSSVMGLPIPTVGLEAGPAYAFDVNTCLTLIDGHDHSPGKGVPITPAGLNINATLDFLGNDQINIENTVYIAQPVATSILQALSVAPGTESPALQDLWYTDSAGNKVQLTSNGLVNATIASIPGESYAAGTFFWKQGAGSTIPANFDIGSITIRPNIALTSFGVTLSPSAGISSAYTLTLPLVPVLQSVVTLDASGVMSTATPDGTTIQISGSVLQVRPGGITNTQLADGAVSGAKLGLVWQYAEFTANGAVTLPVNVQEVFIQSTGGGGGGGSGGHPNGGLAGGGGGGGGSSPSITLYKATAGEILTVVVGAGGIGGAAPVGFAAGNPGTIGATTTVTSNLNGVIHAGAGSTAGGGGNTTSDNGGSGPQLTNFLTLLQTKGGFGGFTSGPGQGGQVSSVNFGTAAAGTFSGQNFAGGGGGSAFGIGGAGGNGSNVSPTAGADAPVSSYGAGGGGGGGNNVGTPGKGGDGRSGFVRIMWLGAPP